MSRKDYQRIATAVRSAQCDFREKLVLVESLINVLKDDNARFDADRFRRACLESN